MLEQHARWIEKAGFSLEQEDQTTKFEISPLVSYSGEVSWINNLDLMIKRYLN